MLKLAYSEANQQGTWHAKPAELRRVHALKLQLKETESRTSEAVLRVPMSLRVQAAPPRLEPSRYPYPLP